MSEPLAISLFSGTDDRLNAAAVLVAGAAALGRPVHLFLQWALDAFRRDRIEADRGLAPRRRQGHAPPVRLRPSPRPPKPNRLWHLGKVVFNKTYRHTVPKGRG